MLSSSRPRGALIAGAMTLPAAPATAATPLAQWVVTGPAGSLSATVTLDEADGSLRLSATRSGRTVLAAAPVGLRTTDADLTRGLRVIGSAQRTPGGGRSSGTGPPASSPAATATRSSSAGSPTARASAHAPSELSVYLGRRCSAFTAAIGLDDETTQPGSVTFQVFGDDALLYDSGILRGGAPAVVTTVDTSGMRMLSLRVTDGGDGRNFDHADWADAHLSCG